MITFYVILPALWLCRALRARRSRAHRFGKGPKAALDKALEIAAELGLDTHNAEGYIGWAQTGPIADGQKYLATITHTDVVPEGNGWDADPYTVRVRDGWLLGRGVADDKGPSILCLYALKYLKDNGVPLKYPVRALLGANEETNMHDVDYFAAHFEQPAFCFTPDAEFPVCNGEKGGFGGELVSPVLENGVIVDFVGGVAHNAVPDRAACTVRLPESALKQTEGVTFEAGENGTTIIRGWGKKRPRRHAARHRKRHWADRYLPAGKQGAPRPRPLICRCCTPCTPPRTAAPWALPPATMCLTR